jgi:hypothetical protein
MNTKKTKELLPPPSNMELNNPDFNADTDDGESSNNNNSRLKFLLVG